MNMEMEEVVEDLYVRTPEHVRAIIKHAKLDERNLTEVTQALYYPAAAISANNMRLLELDDHMLQQICMGHSFHFKGGWHEKVVLCTDERTYDVKCAEISNSLLLVPDLKFAAATSNSPLRSPRTGNISLERSLNDSAEDELEISRTVEHRGVLRVFHEYLECREIRPRYRKLGELLQLTRYSGPENEDCIDRKLLFTYQQLLDTVQCSRKQFLKGLKMYRVLEFNGWMRVLGCEYEYRIVSFMLGLINENSWPLDEIEKEETISALEGIAPKEIVEGLFDIYTEPSRDKEGKYKYDEVLVSRIVAKKILQPGLKFRIDEFMSAWQEDLPEGMKVEESYLSGLAIVEKKSAFPCVRSLAEENLPENIHERIKILFKTKSKWTLDEMLPYIECFTTPALTASTLLAKYARSLTENDVRYYVAKH